ncbi:hypothetical protein [Phyllobacterium sp. P30BS-XVII]|uniref:hypothetical protein n=1 Tax=Phyllobacterium sp. P30BS-XVII TaxID=2587046 RepID=UPI0015F9A87B|nr:hypothetical protein [Phyllobacterium sp. P30BS-XVII]MBA8904161.1 hypothetical protein [Phyllobacterium sp. P30BS-XVII]
MADDHEPAWVAAHALSIGSKEAWLAFSEIMFSLGEYNEAHRSALLERYQKWEKLVDSNAIEIKLRFRQLVDEKLEAWNPRTSP